MLWPLLVESNRSYFGLPSAENDLSWLLKPEGDLAQRMPGLLVLRHWAHTSLCLSVCVSLSLALILFLHVSRVIACERWVRGFQCTGHIPAALCHHLPSSLSQADPETIGLIVGGGLWGNRKALTGIL